jgi:hypothetical protein
MTSSQLCCPFSALIPTVFKSMCFFFFFFSEQLLFRAAALFRGSAEGGVLFFSGCSRF